MVSAEVTCQNNARRGVNAKYAVSVIQPVYTTRRSISQLQKKNTKSKKRSLPRPKRLSKEKEASCHKVKSGTDGSLTSMVLPVYLSSLDNPEQEILVYALLDTMSDATFIVDSVGDELQVPSDAAMLRLTTMTDRCKNIPCRRFENLVVRGFKSATKVPLPAAYSRNSIPLDEAHIPTPETARQWPHLNSLSNQLAPKQDCPIGLLIGYNCAWALAPKNCIPGKNDKPFAVETGLGWSIVSGSQPDSTENFDTFGQIYHTVSMRVETPISTDSQSKVEYVYKAQLKEVTTADFLH